MKKFFAGVVIALSMMSCSKEFTPGVPESEGIDFSQEFSISAGTKVVTPREGNYLCPTFQDGDQIIWEVYDSTDHQLLIRDTSEVYSDHISIKFHVPFEKVDHEFLFGALCRAEADITTDMVNACDFVYHYFGNLTDFSKVYGMIFSCPSPLLLIDFEYPGRISDGRVGAVLQFSEDYNDYVNLSYNLRKFKGSVSITIPIRSGNHLTYLTPSKEVSYPATITNLYLNPENTNMMFSCVGYNFRSDDKNIQFYKNIHTMTFKPGIAYRCHMYPGGIEVENSSELGINDFVITEI